MSDAPTAIVTAIICGTLVFLAVCSFSFGRSSVAADCKNYGYTAIGNEKFECKQLGKTGEQK